MADVEMSDAPLVPKKADDAASKGAEGKKNFEVKKVCTHREGAADRSSVWKGWAMLTMTVERRGPLGLGYRR